MKSSYIIFISLRVLSNCLNFSFNIFCSFNKIIWLLLITALWFEIFLLMTLSVSKTAEFKFFNFSKLNFLMTCFFSCLNFYKMKSFREWELILFLDIASLIMLFCASINGIYFADLFLIWFSIIELFNLIVKEFFWSIKIDIFLFNL